jgi:S1-C subfamily serine protease
MLGVTIQSVDSDMASSLNLPAARGAIVTSVSAGGPADKAGIKRGDVIVAINKQAVVDNNSLRNLVAKMSPGSNVEVSALRNGRDQNFQVALAELPVRGEERESDETSSTRGATGNEKFGLTLQPLTPELASRYGLDADDQGLLVTKVDPASNAAGEGIRQGDLIQEVNRQPVKTFAEFNAAIAQSGSKPALVLIKRRNNVTYITLKPGS